MICSADNHKSLLNSVARRNPFLSAGLVNFRHFLKALRDSATPDFSLVCIYLWTTVLLMTILFYSLSIFQGWTTWHYGLLQRIQEAEEIQNPSFVYITRKLKSVHFYTYIFTILGPYRDKYVNNKHNGIYCMNQHFSKSIENLQSV